MVFRSSIATGNRSICAFGAGCDYMRFDNCEFSGMNGLTLPRALVRPSGSESITGLNKPKGGGAFCMTGGGERGRGCEEREEDGGEMSDYLAFEMGRVLVQQKKAVWDGVTWSTLSICTTRCISFSSALVML